MVLYHKPVKAKASGSGGKRKPARDKRLAHYGGFFVATRVREKEEKGGMRENKGKAKLRNAIAASIATKDGVKKTRVISVLDNPANRQYAREGIITKGAIIETDLGKARVTSRPGQHGVINAVLIEEKKS